jgi:hypothetical protein
MRYTQSRYRQALLWYWLQQHRFKIEVEPSPLLNDLVAYWKLDETSSTRFDSTPNSNDLTDNGSVGSGIGKVGNAASFNGTNFLSVSSSDLNANPSITLAFWAKPDNVTIQGLVTKWPNAIGQRSYQAIIVSNRYQFWVSGDGSNASATVVANSYGVPSTGVFQFVVCWYDHTAGTINIQVNDGTVDTTSYSGGIFGGTGIFRVGILGSGSFYDGLIDEIGVWNRVLTAAERTQLYNSGSGLTYPFV